MLNRGEVVNAIAQGISEGNQRCIQWSGGWCAQDMGVEPLLSSRIAEKLYHSGTKKDQICFVTLETSFKQILDFARIKPTGKLPKILGGRCDVVYYEQSGKPIGLVEVKRWFGYASQKGDIQRIHAMMKKCEEIRWGAVAAIVLKWETNKSSTETRAERFVDKARIDFGDLEFTYVIDHKATKKSDDNVYNGVTLLGYDAIGILFFRK